MRIVYMSMFMFSLDINEAEPWHFVYPVNLNSYCVLLKHVRANKALLQYISGSSFTTPPTTKSRPAATT